MKDNTLKELFNSLDKLDTKLAADGNRYSEEFTSLSITVETKRGRFVDSFSATQKNITGLYNQAARFLSIQDNKNSVTFKVNQ